MKTIAFRPAKLIPADMVFGEGYRNPYVDDLVAIGQEIAQYPDDEQTATVRGSDEQAVAHMMQVVRRIVQTNDEVEKQMGGVTGQVAKQAAADAAAALPVSGWAGPQDLEIAQSGARSRVLRQYQVEVAKFAVARLQPKLDAAASDCVEAFAALATAINRAVANSEVPSSLRADVKLEDLQKRVDCEHEIEAQAQPMIWTYGQIARAIEFSNSEVLHNLIPAARRKANEWLRTPLAKLNGSKRPEATHYPSTSIYTATPGEDDPHVSARKVLRLIADWIDATRPKSIAMAKNHLDRLSPIFAAFLSVAPPDLTERYYVDNDRSAKGPPWANVDPQWPFRFLPPRMALPGWSPIAMYTDGRVPIRKPNDMAADEGPKPVARAEIKNLGSSTFDAQREDLLAELRGGR